MGEIPPCEYEFRAQEVKAFSFRTDGLMFPQSDNPNHPIILLEAQIKLDFNHWYCDNFPVALERFPKTYKPRLSN
jgi:hypothetical protein